MSDEVMSGLTNVLDMLSTDSLPQSEHFRAIRAAQVELTRLRDELAQVTKERNELEERFCEIAMYVGGYAEGDFDITVGYIKSLHEDLQKAFQGAEKAEAELAEAREAVRLIRAAWGRYKECYESSDIPDIEQGRAWDKLNQLNDMKGRYAPPETDDA